MHLRPKELNLTDGFCLRYRKKAEKVAQIIRYHYQYTISLFKTTCHRTE